MHSDTAIGTTRSRTLVLLWLLLAALPGLIAAATPARAADPDRIELFVREGCPHCADAKDFLARLARERPALSIVYRQVDTDASAREDLARMSRQAGVWPPGVPTFVVDGRVLVGFDHGRGDDVVRAFLDEGTAPPDEIETRLFGTLSAARLGLPLFTLALGLIDPLRAARPCGPGTSLRARVCRPE